VAGHLIVVIDDDRDTCEAFAEWLQLEGDEVVCADSVDSAEHGLAGRTPDVCILDLQLRAESGLDVFRVLRARRPEFCNTVPIVLTGMPRWKAEGMIEAGQVAGVILLTKPIDPDRLSSVIHGAIAARGKSDTSGEALDPQRLLNARTRLDPR
jgi:two-component system response regulator HydG